MKPGSSVTTEGGVLSSYSESFVSILNAFVLLPRTISSRQYV
jgi:hypothetical protein